MKSKVKRIFSYIIIGFFVLFIIRFIYGYLAYPNNNIQQFTNAVFDSTLESLSLNNYATEKVARKSAAISSNQPLIQETGQKYEKIASLGSASDQFTEDEEKTKSTIKKHKALIQFEQNYGTVGHRNLRLAIGVDPNKFEEMVEDLKQIGNINNIRIEKTDKTSEYKNLNAKKLSLEKIRNNLIQIKSKSGKIEELVNLETKILDIETQIQSFGVSLGEYDEENEFCTVKFNLQERKFKSNKIGIPQRIKVALEWTFKYYCLWLSILFFAFAISTMMVIILDKLSPMLKKMWKEDNTTKME